MIEEVVSVHLTSFRFHRFLTPFPTQVQVCRAEFSASATFTLVASKNTYLFNPSATLLYSDLENLWVLGLDFEHPPGSLN